MKILLPIFALLFSLSVNAQTIEIKTISVDPCLSFQNYEHFKRLTLSSPDSRAEYIKGFDFEWGYQYKLSVKETKLSPELSDGTQFDYELERIVSKTKMPDSTEFRLHLDPEVYYYELTGEEEPDGRAFKQLDDSTYIYHEEVQIEVPAALEEKFNVILEQKKSKKGWFVYVSPKRIRLVRL